MSNAPAAADPRDPLIGRILAEKYELVSMVGVGAMGRVYRATQKPLQRVVAVKILHANLAADEQARQRFLREARAASRFEHPNSMRVFDYGVEHDGIVYIVLEFLEGRALQQIIDAEAPLTLPRIVQIMGEALSALAAAHDAGIVHRDLKPENIMLVTGRDEDGEDVEAVKVADFGIAKILEEREEGVAKLTGTGLVPGTPAYMSPEQAGGKPVDARSDLYACGVILYEMATKRLPFTADNAIAVVLKHLTEIPPPPSQVNPAIDARLEAIILKALNKLPHERFPDARTMRAALREAVNPVAAALRTSDAHAAAQPFPDLVTPTPGPVEKVVATSAPSPANDNPAPARVAPALREGDAGQRSRALPWVAAAVALAAVVAFVAPRANSQHAPMQESGVVVLSSGDTQAHEPPPPPPPPMLLQAPADTVATGDASAGVPSATMTPDASTETHGSPAVVPTTQGDDRAPRTPPPRRGGPRTGSARVSDAGAAQTAEPAATPPSDTQPADAQTSTTPTATPPTDAGTSEAPAEQPPESPPPQTTEPAAPPPVATPTPTPTLRNVRGRMESLSVSGGVTRGLVQTRVTRAVSSLAQCVERNAMARGGASALPSPVVCMVTVNVRDRRVDQVSFSGGNPLFGGCDAQVRGAFSGELPQSEDTEYTIAFHVSLTPEQ